ncbi:transcription initiation factor TFIID subunit 12-like [Diabrotica virgifera virgifera]|uniref:Uncharacterized protein n=1 Tax=Diabrotica virgifera virgifera TaxID=50390 RepID=A0ABM5KFV9_DIAVI|nr:transcription initiation factor TFIID subunit 12-like [Diabrotica virgifera virgifera]
MSCQRYNTITSNATTSNTTNLDSTNSNPPTSNTTNPDPTNSTPTSSKALPETSQNTQYITNLPYNQTEQKLSDKTLISTSNDHPASSQNILVQIPDVQVSNNQLESTIETDDMSRPTNNTNETNTLKIPTSSTSNKISNLTPLEITQPKIIPNVTKHLKRLISSSPEINENTTQTDSHIFTSPGRMALCKPASSQGVEDGHEEIQLYDTVERIIVFNSVHKIAAGQHNA